MLPTDNIKKEDYKRHILESYSVSQINVSLFGRSIPGANISVYSRDCPGDAVAPTFPYVSRIKLI